MDKVSSFHRAKDSAARLFINRQTQPVLIVNDLKLGAHRRGAIGLFVDVGTEGFFRELYVMNQD